LLYWFWIVLVLPCLALGLFVHVFPIAAFFSDFHHLRWLMVIASIELCSIFASFVSGGYAAIRSPVFAPAFHWLAMFIFQSVIL
jgi:hypothetical protein